MTDAQRKRFYGPAWRRAWTTCWRVDRGTILPREGRPSAHENSGLIRPELVEGWAEQFARDEFQKMTEHDLRRAVRLIALGRDVRDGKTLSNQDLQKVVQALKVLSNPDDLNAVLPTVDPSSSARSRLVSGILKSGLPEAYLTHLASRLYGSISGGWRSLPDGDLRAFSRLVWKRSAAKRRAKA